MAWTADFETTTNPNDCRVWAFGLCNIEKPENFLYGNNIDDFIKWCQSNKNQTIYFHNLKFDGEFILHWLFDNGFRHITDKRHAKSKTFTTLISSQNQFYSMTIYFEVDGKNKNKVTIYDSLKILPFTVETIAKAFNLEISKLVIDYKQHREKGHILTEEEVEYLKADVKIVAKALKILFDQNLTKMTQGSNALYDFKQITGAKRFEKLFPPPDYDADIRQSYKGGWTYVKDEYRNKEIECGIVLDVNSLYPSVMYYKPLPYGEGIHFKGKYENDNIYDLYVQMFSCQFELKDKHLPTIQLKNSLSFNPTDYLTSSDDEIVTLCLTSVDLDLFFKHYDVYNIEYHSGWKFKSTLGLFNNYIDKWNGIKIQATLDGNKGMRTLAKLMLNSLYGKFALNPNVQSKLPVKEDGIIKYKLGEQEQRKHLYIPVGTFITAWARYTTITAAQSVYDNFVYADTDSLHLKIELPDKLKNMNEKEFEKLTTEDFINAGVTELQNLHIDPTQLGAWKAESKFTRAKFLRQKSYIEEVDGELKVTCAGMPNSCHGSVTWENFRIGQAFDGKLQQKHVEGGIVLVDNGFTIKG